MISQLSHKLAIKLCQYSNRKQEVEYVRFGLEIVLGGLLKIILLLILSSLFGVVHIMLAAFLTFAFFRSITGGQHFSTYLRCLMAGLLLLLGISIITTKFLMNLSIEIHLVLLAISILFAMILTYFYAPSNHFYKISTQQQRNKLRQLAFLMICLWGTVLLFLFKMNVFPDLLLASILGLLFQISSIHPLAYTILDKIEKILDWRSKDNEKNYPCNL